MSVRFEAARPRRANVLAAELANRQTGMTQPAIGGYYGGASAAVSNIWRRIRRGEYDTHEAVQQRQTAEPVSG